MSTMLAAVLTAPRRFEIREVPIPKIGPSDALIRVSRVGICGTDIHIFNGHYAAEQLPLVPGHEFSGTIEALGQDVRHLQLGSKAVADINIGCGRCFYCRRNETFNCAEMQQIGITRAGAFAEFVSVPAHLVIPAPDDADFAVLALTEPVACVVRAARRARIGFGQSVAIIGAGPIGNLHVQLMRLLGAAPIVVIEPNVVRAELARSAGADVLITDPDIAIQTVRMVTDGRGADVVIESVGQVKLYELAYELARPGGHVSAFGITGPEARLGLPILDVILREKSIRGSVAGMGEDMHDALTLLRYGRFQLEAFTGAAYPLSDIQSAFENLASNPAVLKLQIHL